MRHDRERLQMSLAIAAAKPVTFKLSELVLDPALLLRPLDEETAQGYSEVLKAKRELPPILVMRVAGVDGAAAVILVIDGQHRYRAHQIAKRDRIACEVREGTRSDALLASAGANDAHGKPRSVEHRRAAVLALRAQPEWAEASARWLAEKCNVSPNFVLGILKAEATAHGEQLAPSRGKDGKIRKAPKKPKRKPFDAAKQVKALARTIDQLAKKWPSDAPADVLVELLLSRAAEFEKRKQVVAA